MFHIHNKNNNRTNKKEIKLKEQNERPNCMSGVLIMPILWCDNKKSNSEGGG